MKTTNSPLALCGPPSPREDHVVELGVFFTWQNATLAGTQHLFFAVLTSAAVFILQLGGPTPQQC